MILTATLPADALMPEDTWMNVRVRRHGQALEIEANVKEDALQQHQRRQAFEDLQALISSHPPSVLSDEELDEGRWQHFKEKYGL